MLMGGRFRLTEATSQRMVRFHPPMNIIAKLLSYSIALATISWHAILKIQGDISHAGLHDRLEVWGIVRPGDRSLEFPAFFIHSSSERYVFSFTIVSSKFESRGQIQVQSSSDKITWGHVYLQFPASFSFFARKRAVKGLPPFCYSIKSIHSNCASYYCHWRAAGVWETQAWAGA